MFYQGLTQEIAKEAMDLVAPTVERMLATYGHPTNRHFLHVVVLKPGTDEVLWDHNFGYSRTQWNRPYNEIALAKARQCQRTGMTSRTLATNAPWMIDPKVDTRYVGGVIENGLVVAASGQRDIFDEMVSWIVLSAIQALCRIGYADLPGDLSAFYRNFPETD